MITLTTAQWSAMIASFLWPLTRVLGMIAGAPILGSASLPARVKVGLAVAVSILIAPTITVPPVEPWSGAGFGILIGQFLIGAAIGFVMQISFTAVDFAGEISGLQMGLGFASFFDLQNSNPEPVISQFFGLLATLLFIGMNGHLILLAALVHSFEVLPIGAPWSAAPWLTLVESGSQIFLSGFMLALPVIAVLLVVNIALGVLTRAAPQLSLFSVGFPLTLLIGAGAMLLVLPHLGAAMVKMFGGMLELADNLFRAVPAAQ